MVENCNQEQTLQLIFSKDYFNKMFPRSGCPLPCRPGRSALGRMWLEKEIGRSAWSRNWVGGDSKIGSGACTIRLLTAVINTASWLTVTNTQASYVAELITPTEKFYRVGPRIESVKNLNTKNTVFQCFSNVYFVRLSVLEKVLSS